MEESERKADLGAPPVMQRANLGGRAVLALALLALMVLLAGCATSGDLKKVKKTNRVQNRRLSSIEKSVGEGIGRNAGEIKTAAEEIETNAEALKALQDRLRATDGRLLNLTEKTERMAGEQAATSLALEKALAQNRSLRNRLTEQQKIEQKTRTEQKKDLDAVRLRLGDLEKLLKTSIAALPAKTKADQAFRRAFTHLVHGELDFAAEKFVAFGKAFPKEARVAEAKLRAGQAYFLLRKYDHAIVPFFELVDKFANHKLAVDARWMLARSLEETGDLKLAREFYAQLISANTIHKSDATRRVYFIDQLYPKLKNRPGAKGKGSGTGTAKRK